MQSIVLDNKFHAEFTPQPKFIVKSNLSDTISEKSAIYAD